MSRTTVEMITFDGAVSSQFDAWWAESQLSHRGFDFSVVTVLGCQSSGKSTLLNAMFGTEFEIMDSSRGRHQTTKGLWVSADAGRKGSGTSTLVIDVEGTDSKERGEDRLTFEHRASLFCLALADVVIVNMWYNDLGRYTASNYGLLKTVFEVNLELFLQSPDAPRTTMLFVIRDHSPAQTDIETLRIMLNDDVTDIWEKISKPDKFKDAKASQFFDFQVVGLPSKITCPESWDTGVDAIRSRWIEEWRPKEYSRQVPADGFLFYTHNVWQTILQSAELDIPSQKAMLAAFRCDEIMRAALDEVTPLMVADTEESIGSLSILTPRVVNLALNAFDESASRYDVKVFEQKRLQLIERLQSELQKKTERALGSLRKDLLSEANDALEALGIDNLTMQAGSLMDAHVQMEALIKKWRVHFLSQFDSLTSTFSFPLPQAPKDASGPGSFDLSTESARDALCEALDLKAFKAKERLRQALLDYLRLTCNRRIGRSLDALLSGCSVSPAKLVEGLNDVLVGSVMELWPEFEPVSGVLGLNRDVFVEKIARYEKSLLEDLASESRFMSLLLQRFTELFNNDQDGVPREWRSVRSSDIRGWFLEAKAQIDQVIELFAQPLDVRSGLEALSADAAFIQEASFNVALITGDRRVEMLERANRETKRICRDAQMINAANNQSNVPPVWAMVMMVILGWNEMMLVVSSPFTVILLLVGGLLGASAWFTGRKE